MIWQKLGFKTKAAIVMIAGIFMSGVLVWYGASAVNIFVQAEEVWSDYNRTNTKTTQLLNRINKHLGYGGFIHKFKDYVLRADDKYLYSLEVDKRQIFDAITQYREENISQAEREALSELSDVMNEYVASIEVARLGFAYGDSTAVIDNSVTVNDFPALQALSTLSAAALKRSQEMEVIAEGWLEKKNTYMALGFFIVPLILVMAVVFVRFLWLTIRANRTAEIAQQEVESLLQTAPDAMLTVDEQGNIVRANQRAESIFHYSVAELCTMHIDALIPVYARASHAALMKGYIDNPQPRRMGQDRDLVALTKEGDDIPVEIRLSTVKTDTGRLATATVRDISEQMRSAKLVRENEERLSLSQAIAKVGTWDWNIHTGGLIWSKEIYAIFGVSPDAFEPSYERFVEFIYPDDRDGVTAAVNASVKHDLPYNIEHRILLQNGDVRYVHERGEVYRDENGIPIRMIGVVLDITERKEFITALETAKVAADEASAAKSQFLANMSHEIRTPMHAILGMGYLMQKSNLEKHQSDYLDKIMGSTRSLLRIINDILDFSKIEAGKLELEHAPFSLAEVMDNVANVVGAQIEDKRLELLFSVDADVPGLLVGDQLRIEQALINLAGNAVKFTEQGEVVVQVSTYHDIGQDDIMLKFSVRDTGIGLSRAQVDMLFEAFHQADTSTTRKFGGTGLGLTITSQLVKMMGGEVEVESTKDLGSVFSFTVRVGVQAEQGKPHTAPQDIHAMRALVADDNDTARKILSDMLQRFGLVVTAVSSGEDAVNELQRAAKEEEPSYDLVFLDWIMEGLDGLETAAKIRTSNLPATPKIIIVTAYSRDLSMEGRDQVEFDGYLTKPVVSSVLFETVMHALGHKSFARQQNMLKEITADVRKALSGAKVLIVEDNAINQQVAQEILVDVGVDVEIAGDGNIACRMICDEGQKFDAVLMDLHMPIMDGYVATKRLRKDFSTQDFPIIAMTANAMRGERQKCFDAGMNDFISKPIDVNGFYITLLKWLPGASDRVLAKDHQEQNDLKMDTTESTNMSEHETPLPDTLDGFDMVDGLDRMLGRPELYRKFLLKLDDGHANDSALIHDALKVGDRELAHRLAHTVKGVAGNLSAQDLYQAATILSDALKKDEVDVRSELDAFDAELERALRSVRSLKQGPREAQAPQGATSPSYDASSHETDAAAIGDREHLRTLLNDINAMLINHSMGAGKHVQSLRKALADSPNVTQDLEGLAQAVRKLDYSTARGHLTSLATELDLPIG